MIEALSNIAVLVLGLSSLNILLINKGLDTLLD